ncbi:ABC transporter permease [Rhodococcus sp. X156]|uniref:ABC transporter permease n=1 Tax=Rhodococcus sp. X156 TaxID=2499145 RepID=UPI001F49E2AE|nr:ABC transporter permease [Rhodococcus sp. X156]
MSAPVASRDKPAPSPRPLHHHARPAPGGLSQWLTLAGRHTRAMGTNGELVVSLVAPPIFALGFDLPLRSIMDSQGVDYGQFITPIIVLQAMSFIAVSSAVRAAYESVNGMTTRMRTMPVNPAAPLAGRMTASAVRVVVSLLSALLSGYLLGFRFENGVDNAVLFCGFAFVIALVLSIGADALGTLSHNPEATSQILTLPQLVLGMLSTGYVPEEGFPEWIQPFVRNQPVSHFCAVMRSLAEGTGDTTHVLPALLWLGGLAAAFTLASVHANLRRG